MSSAALTMNVWSLEYQSHKTIAATDHARLKVAQAQQQTIPKVVKLTAEMLLVLPFWGVTRQTEKLVVLLDRMEALPSAILLEDEMESIPQSLHELFRKMCAVIQQTEEMGLHEGILLKSLVARLTELSQQITSNSAIHHGKQLR